MLLNLVTGSGAAPARRCGRRRLAGGSACNALGGQLRGYARLDQPADGPGEARVRMVLEEDRRVRRERLLAPGSGKEGPHGRPGLGVAIEVRGGREPFCLLAGQLDVRPADVVDDERNGFRVKSLTHAVPHLRQPGQHPLLRGGVESRLREQRLEHGLLAGDGGGATPDLRLALAPLVLTGAVLAAVYQPLERGRSFRDLLEVLVTQRLGAEHVIPRAGRICGGGCGGRGGRLGRGGRISRGGRAVSGGDRGGRSSYLGRSVCYGSVSRHSGLLARYGGQGYGRGEGGVKPQQAPAISKASRYCSISSFTPERYP